MSATHACRLLVEREDDQFLYRDGWIAALLIVFMVAAPARIFAQGGSLDTTFGGVGKVFTDFGGFGNGRRDLITAVLTDAQERMIAVGSSEAPIGSSLGSVVALARYTSNGSLDPTFGSNGRATSEFGFGLSAHNYANAAVLDSSGRIIVVGCYRGRIGNF